MKNAIEISGLNKEYKSFAIRDMSFNVPAGSITGFIGQNGAGKTTTIKLILNLLSRSKGEIKIFDCDNIKDETAIKDDVGVVFDQNPFSPVLRPRDFDKIMRFIYTNWDSDKYGKLLKRFKLDDNKRIAKLSKGMQMKLQLAVALSHNAKLLIMDEPTGGLDPIIRNEVLDYFLEFIGDSEHSILLSSHITSDLERVADYITFIDDGTVLLSEDKLTLLENHKILKCGADKPPAINGMEIIETRKSPLGADVLVKAAPEVMQNCSVPYDDASLDEIMYFYVKRKEGVAV